MFSLTQKIRAYRTEQRRHAQIAREIDDALTNRHFLHPHPPIDPAYRQQIVSAQRRIDVASEEIAAKGLNQLQKMRERIGANAGY